MEKLKAKHDHKLTDILKVFIFALFLMMPFLTYMPNALYYGCNEHAVNETSTQVDIQYKYQSNEVNNLDDLVEGNIYKLVPNEVQQLSYLTCTQIYGYRDTNSNVGVELICSVDNGFYINLANNDITVYQAQVIDNNNTNIYNYNISKNQNIYFVYKDYVNPQIINYINESDFNEIESVDVQTDVQNTITENMQQAWERMWQSQMYNWTNESVLKQGLDNFTGVFGVSDTSYFTNLLVYELIMLAIYVVIDIVITLFTWLTHLIGEK